MKYFALSQMGEFHVNHNEDFISLEELSDTRKLIAVMDGCSSGTDSHFASTLIGKILRKLAKQEAYRTHIQKVVFPLEDLLEKITLALFEELRDIHRLLDLKSDEILSTLILGIVDDHTQNAELVIVGDGYVFCDGAHFEYENDNKPDYIGYHLNMDKHLWYQTRTTKQSFKNFSDLTIATDGIHTFKNFDGKSYPTIDTLSIMSEFFIKKEHIDNPNMLKKVLIMMKQEYGLLPSDDLSMIRILS